ncbi:MAG: hypothetical protein K9G34_06040, partial [Melioribacteraceae bacterium]|nr:hypothetical protein [Melioribacteraceae bacterium]
SFENGITSVDLGKPIYKNAIIQHRNYIDTLKACGLEIIELPPLEDFPDSTFVEDPALVFENFAVITRPGAESRKGEILFIKPIVEEHFQEVYEVKSPGTLEGGDILRVENHVFIGMSERTNESGADQLLEILKTNQMSGEKVELHEILHLKTGCSYLGDGNILVSPALFDFKGFHSLNKILVDKNEEYAANSLRINNFVIIPDGFPKIKEELDKMGYFVKTIDVSEFRKMDGGLSCLSLRF